MSYETEFLNKDLYLSDHASQLEGKTKIREMIFWAKKFKRNFVFFGKTLVLMRLCGKSAGLLIYEAIKFASQVTAKFDFEGSMLEPVERFFRAFGATQKPYFQIKKENSRILKIMLDIKGISKW